MDDRTLFERAMRRVEPLDGPSRRVDRPRRQAPGSRQPSDASSAPLSVDTYGEHREGWAGEAGARALVELRAGEHPVERKIDLHGLAADDARLLVRDVLRTAWRTGQRCLQLVHGRGRRSAGGAVLRESLPEWLAEAPHGRRVLAFTSAVREGGRGGATLVLLRRRRRARGG